VKRLRDRLQISTEDLAARLLSEPSTLYRWFSAPEKDMKGPVTALLDQIERGMTDPTALVNVMMTGTSSTYVTAGRVYVVPDSDDPLSKSIRAMLEAHGAQTHKKVTP
jgi:hypothetical protein